MLRNAYNAHLVLLTYVWWAVAECSALQQCSLFRFQHSFFLNNGRSNISLVGELRHSCPTEQRRCTPLKYVHTALTTTHSVTYIVPYTSPVLLIRKIKQMSMHL